MSDHLVAVTITGPNEAQLTELCRHLVMHRLAACANITPQVRSLYWWDDRVQDEAEAAATLHTTHSHLKAIQQVAQERHPYDVPQVAATAMECSANYGDWLRACLQADGRPLAE